MTRLVNTEGGPRGAKDAYGPLSALFGTWVGAKGWNLIAIPANKRPTHDINFELIVRPYYEIITISPISAPVLNHGGPTTESIMGAEYSLQINDAVNDDLLHVENGMWLLLTSDPMLGESTIARQATVPHGDSVLAIGSWSMSDGAPEIPVVRPNPTNTEGAPDGYAEQTYRIPPADFPDFHIANPFEHLSDAIAGQDIVSTIRFQVATSPLGGINNIPFIREHVNASVFEGWYWVETVRGDDGGLYQQLQYAQNTMLDFFQFVPKGGQPHGKVHWPHMNLNTLLKL